MAIVPPDEQAIFDVARKIPSVEAREAYLQQICGDDAAMGRRVRALLQAYEESASFLESPITPLDTTIGEPMSECPGSVIGPYKLLQQIGEGGMGSVWMAEQTRPVQRKVALKIIKLGMDSKQVIARFEAERQALALMDHPNIAKVLDAGATVSGRSYFVMELVKGQPITRYCNEHHLAPRQRLELFLPVCHAIQHAHQKGIVHRDIKPSNVLVAPYDGEPVVKVIDYGVVKAMGQRLTEHTLFTEFGQVVGTLEYMSPEQAELNNEDIDTRSDIYSLGVLLYELLTGTTPLSRERLKAAAFTEMLRLIREAEPPKPSTRLSESTAALPAISAQRQTEPEKLAKLVRGELDWIVMKALEKDRNRRYETANGFAMDVQRYLTDEPVLACPPSAWYRFRKFARRHRAGFAVAGMILLFLVLLGGGAGWMVRDRAEREQAAIREQTEREQAAARDRAARQVRLDGEITRALEEAQTAYQQDKLHEAMGALKRAEGLLASGGDTKELQSRTHELRTDLEMVARLEEIRLETPALDAGDFDVAATDAAYDKAFREFGLDLAMLDANAAAERIRQSSIRGHWVTALDDWAWHKGQIDRPGRDRLWAVARLADPDDWRDRLREASVRLEPLPRGVWTMPSEASVGEAQKTLHDLAIPEKVARLPPATALMLARAFLRTKDGKEAAVEILLVAQRGHPADFWLNWELAQVLRRWFWPARIEEAISYLRAAQALRPHHAAPYLELAKLEHYLGRVDQAIANCERAVSLQPSYAAGHAVLGDVYLAKGAWNDAVSAYQQSLRLDADPRVRFRLGRAHVYQGAWPEALAAFDEANRPGSPNKVVATRRVPTGAPAVTLLGGWTRSLTALEFDVDHAAAFLVVGDKQGYSNHCQQALDSKRFGKNARRDYLLARTCTLAPDGPADRALPLARDAVAHEANAWHLHTLGTTYYRVGKYEQAIAQLDRSREVQPDWEGRACNWLVLAMAHHRLGRADEARRWLTKARDWLQQVRPKTPPEEIGPLPGLACHDWLACHLLHREALELVQNEKSTPRKGGKPSIEP